MGEHSATKSSKDKDAGQTGLRSMQPMRQLAQSDPHANIFALQNVAGNRAVSELVQPATSYQLSAANDVPPIVRDVLRSSGQLLDRTTRAFMESRFGHDFSQVRIHDDPQAAESAEALGTKAYTVGSNMVFGQYRYSPDTTDGKRLLAHELAHVVQQSSGGARLPNSIGSDPLEQEAESAARAIATDAGPAPITGTSAVGVACQREEKVQTTRIQVIPDVSAGKLRVVRTDARGNIVAGLAEITPPAGVALDISQVAASIEASSKPGHSKNVVTLPERWGATTNPTQDVELQRSTHKFAEDTISEKEDEFEKKRGEIETFLEERPWHDLAPLFRRPNVPTKETIDAVYNSMEFKDWQLAKGAQGYQLKIERENEYYQDQIYRQTGLLLTPKEAREVWEHNNRAYTDWEKEQIKSTGGLPNELRDPETGELVGYYKTIFAAKHLGGVVGTVTTIILDRDGKIVRPEDPTRAGESGKETTVLTPATEFFQDVVRSAPISGNLINAAESEFGLSLDLRDFGSVLTKGEQLDRTILAVPFGNTVRTGMEAASGVSLSGKDLDTYLSGEVRLLSSRERTGKAVIFGLEVASTALGHIKPKIKGKPRLPHAPDDLPAPPRARVRARVPTDTSDVAPSRSARQTGVGTDAGEVSGRVPRPANENAIPSPKSGSVQREQLPQQQSSLAATEASNENAIPWGQPMPKRAPKPQVHAEPLPAAAGTEGEVYTAQGRVSVDQTNAIAGGGSPPKVPKTAKLGVGSTGKSTKPTSKPVTTSAKPTALPIASTKKAPPSTSKSVSRLVLTSSSDLPNGKISFSQPDPIAVNTEAYVHRIDSGGRPLMAEGFLKEISEIRNPSAQRAVSDPYNVLARRSTDASHLIGREFGGSGEGYNLIPLESDINKSQIRQLETDLLSRIRNGEKIYLQVYVEYIGNGKTPSKVTYRIFHQQGESLKMIDQVTFGGESPEFIQ